MWVRCRGKVDFDSEGKPYRMLGAHSDVTSLMRDLKNKESVLDNLCSTSLDGFWDWNMVTGEEFLSTRWKKTLGYEDDEIPNTREAWRSLLHPSDVSKSFEAVRRHTEEGAPYSVVLRYRRKDGTWAHMLAQGVAQKDEETGQWVSYLFVYSSKAPRSRKTSSLLNLSFLLFHHGFLLMKSRGCMGHIQTFPIWKKPGPMLDRPMRQRQLS